MTVRSGGVTIVDFLYKKVSSSVWSGKWNRLLGNFMQKAQESSHPAQALRCMTATLLSSHPHCT